MSSIYIAVSKVVKVPVGPATGHRVARILRAGDIIPEGVDQAHLDKLEARGIIEKVDVPDDTGELTTTASDADAEIPEGEPNEDWKGKQLESYAKLHGVDISKAKKKSDMVEAIETAALTKAMAGALAAGGVTSAAEAAGSEQSATGEQS